MERHNIPTPVSAPRRLAHERSYEEVLDEARKGYVAVSPPFTFAATIVREGDRRDVILASSTGNLPRPPVSAVTIVARGWDEECFWTLDRGANRIILKAKTTSGCWGGCQYFRWLGKNRGYNRSGLSERAFAFAMPSAKVMARYPHMADLANTVRNGPPPSNVAPSLAQSAQQSVTQDALNDLEDESMADASHAIPFVDRAVHAKRHYRIIAPRTPAAAADEMDQKKIIEQDRAFCGNNHRPSYVELRLDRQKRHYSSFKAFIMVQGEHEGVVAIQTVLSRNWNRKYRYWTVELDGVVRIVEKTKSSRYTLRLWLGHEHGLGEVVGFGDFTDGRLKSDDVTAPKSSRAKGSLEAEGSGEYSTTSWLQRRLTL